VIKYEFILKDWKYGCIIKLHKGGNKLTKYPTNYRGITLLPVFFKLFENVMANRLLEIVDSDKFPCKQQMAYQKGLSSLHTSFNLQDGIIYLIKYGECVIVLFLDSTKAFDTMWHEDMLFKVYELGIHGKCWRIFWNI
jgi:hypothetical protein